MVKSASATRGSNPPRARRPMPAWKWFFKMVRKRSCFVRTSADSVRELAISYFEVYFNLRRERSLRTFSRPVNLARFDRLQWMTTDQQLWFVAEYLFDIHHYRLLTPGMARKLHRLDDRSFRAGCLGRAEK